MKVSLFYCSEDMYSHECVFKKANTVAGGNTIDAIWDYYFGDFGHNRAALKMYVFDDEAMTVELVREHTVALKKKIIINGKNDEQKAKEKLKKVQSMYGTFGMPSPLFQASIPSIVDIAEAQVQANIASVTTGNSQQQW
jgi:hypothetical protein